jgi:putative hydroxymethylpyrimidine transporter CytX
MAEKKVSFWTNNLIWLGAGISLAEILAGILLAPLGFEKGILALILGHGLGCLFLFLAGWIGGKTGKNAMETIAISFGYKGAHFFALLNALQLIGWTGIMIYDGAQCASEAFMDQFPLWCIVLGALLVLWLRGRKELTLLNSAAVILLLLLTAWLGVSVFQSASSAAAPAGGMSFGAGFELAVSMPLSWLPLISDYTSQTKRGTLSAAGSAICYGLSCTFMASIGLCAALATGVESVANIMIMAGLGVAGLVIIIFSTVTTTFLDAYSMGVSLHSVFQSVEARTAAMAAVVIGTIGAILFPLDNISDFLYLIGSVFAPMTAILLTDYFLLGKRVFQKGIVMNRMVLWAIGFLLYRYFLTIDLPLGSTAPDMMAVIILGLIWHAVRGEKEK